ncbi:helicase [Streptomyces sp. NBC_01390]|uniref:DEAD/DEAH box helicase family protein n=1 Tax=Streptomyces sp. NBC_01390 TaxID=2903850 RepID=UPI00324FB858
MTAHFPTTGDGPRAPRPTSRARVHVLLADALQYPDVSRHPDWGLPVYYGRRLPTALARYAAVPHSLERLVEDLLNEAPVPVAAAGGRRPGLRPHQIPRVKAIQDARAAKAPGFLLVSPTGSGKTAMVLTALNRLSLDLVLVITTLSMVPVWQLAIDYFCEADPRRRWVVTNPEKLVRLFNHPQVRLHGLPSDQAARFAAQWGKSRLPWDAVVLDESQMAADPQSIRSRLLHRLTHPPAGEKPFFIPASATPFSKLAETAYAADLIAHAAGSSPPQNLVGAEYLEWLRGLRLTPGKGRAVADPTEKVKALLYRGGVGASASQEELGLPPQHREIHRIRLTAEDHALYEATWEEFRRRHGLEVSEGFDAETDHQASALRRIQKASLLKAPYVARHVAELVGRGCQVIVPAWFLENVELLTKTIADELYSRGLPDKVVAITGEAPGLRELKRTAFQDGRALVCVTNVVQGMNLQASEANVAGTGQTATETPRITVFADILTGGRKFLQGEGRGQRDGREAPAHYLLADGTTETHWLANALRAVAGTQELTHALDDAAALHALADQLDDEATAT